MASLQLPPLKKQGRKGTAEGVITITPWQPGSAIEQGDHASLPDGATIPSADWLPTPLPFVTGKRNKINVASQQSGVEMGTPAPEETPPALAARTVVATGLTGLTAVETSLPCLIGIATL